MRGFLESSNAAVVTRVWTGTGSLTVLVAVSAAGGRSPTDLFSPLVVNADPDRMTLSAGNAACKAASDRLHSAHGWFFARCATTIPIFIVMQPHFIEGSASDGNNSTGNPPSPHLQGPPPRPQLFPLLNV